MITCSDGLLGTHTRANGPGVDGLGAVVLDDGVADGDGRGRKSSNGDNGETHDADIVRRS